MLTLLLSTLEVGTAAAVLMLVVVVYYLNRDLRHHMREETESRHINDKWRLEHLVDHAPRYKR